MAELYDASREVEESTSPFHDDNVKAFILLTLLQIRDIQAALLKKEYPAGYTQVREAHKAGTLVLEPPYLLPQGEGGSDEEE